MRFHANHVSASAAGDYYQLWLGARDSNEEKTDPHQATGPYLIVQRDFEMPDGGRCYVETHDASYVGHFWLRLIEFCPTRLAFEIQRKKDNHVEVSFAMEQSEFLETRRIVQVIFGEREPDPEPDDAL